MTGPKFLSERQIIKRRSFTKVFRHFVCSLVRLIFLLLFLFVAVLRAISFFTADLKFSKHFSMVLEASGGFQRDGK
jgi:hypothetical protein